MQINENESVLVFPHQHTDRDIVFKKCTNTCKNFIISNKYKICIS